MPMTPNLNEKSYSIIQIESFAKKSIIENLTSYRMLKFGEKNPSNCGNIGMAKKTIHDLAIFTEIVKIYSLDGH